MLKSKASLIAREGMKSGNNCCQAVLLAAGKVWDIPLGKDMMAAASLFGGGLGQLPATILYSYVGGMLVGSAKTMALGLSIVFALTIVIFVVKQFWQERNCA